MINNESKLNVILNPKGVKNQKPKFVLKLEELKY